MTPYTAGTVCFWLLGLDEYEDSEEDRLCFTEESKGDMLEGILAELLSYAVEAGIIEDTVTQRDLF